MRRTGWWVAGVLVCWVPAAQAQSANMGATFHELERKAERVVVRFGDADVEATRAKDGRWRATLRDAKGQPRASLDGQRGHRSVQFQPATNPAAGYAFELAESSDTGLDWAAVQLYTNWVDAADDAREGRVADPAAAVWDGHVRRLPRATGRGRSVAQLAAGIREVRTTFPDVDVTATVDTHQRAPTKGKRVDYSRFTARVRERKSGRDLGFIRWFDTAQVVTWKIEGGGSGVIMPDRLREGWTFTPTMAWANVQAYYFASRPKQAAGEVAVARFRDLFTRPAAAAAVGQAAWLGTFGALAGRAVGSLPLPAWGASPIALNEPGCDNLHWLDESIFRVCCDRHDTCYERNGCSASSWRWPFSGSWNCARCNGQAMYCFCTLANPYHCGGSGGGGGGSDDSGNCARVSGGFCPVECQSCIAS